MLNPNLLIMDEPTSVLTPQEVEQLFVVLRQLAKEGCSILYISHKLHEIKALCDTATILRGGKLVDTCDPKVETSRSMAEKMIGGGLKDIQKPAGRTFGEKKLVVDALSVAGTGTFDISLKDISFDVRAGEIFGIAGVAGNGQNALLLALSGEVLVRQGRRSQCRWRRRRPSIGQDPTHERHGKRAGRAQWTRRRAGIFTVRQHHSDGA